MRGISASTPVVEEPEYVEPETLTSGRGRPQKDTITRGVLSHYEPIEQRASQREAQRATQREAQRATQLREPQSSNLDEASELIITGTGRQGPAVSDDTVISRL